jgi:pilus assembly protein TadC
MNRSTGTIILAGILGAAAAAAVAYLFTSERGRAWLRRLPEATRDLTREGHRLLEAVEKVAAEVEQSLDQVQHVIEQVVEAAHPAGEEPSGHPALGSQPV